jgi:uncharacterized protein (TIGR04255 family)
MAESASSGSARIKFENPPITELVLAIFHLPVLELRAEHIGIYWHGIRDRYPLCQQQVPVGGQSDPQAFLNAPGEVLPMPRFWFSNASKTSLIQVQRNAFLFNWRRTPDAKYPHYETVTKDFWREFNHYKVFVERTVGGKLDVVQRCELSYVNLIPTTGAPSLRDLGQVSDVLPFLLGAHKLEQNGRKIAGMNVVVSYRVSSTLAVDLAIQGGKRPDTEEFGAQMELKAHGQPIDLSLKLTESWFDTAHDAIYSLFLDSTNKEVQREIWKPL